MEYIILDFIRDNLSCPIMDKVMVGITFLGNAGWIWILMCVILIFIPKTRKIGLAVGLALILNLIICNLTLKPLIARTRPFDLKEGIELIISKPNDFSFPSGHTSVSFAASVAVFMNDKKYGCFALALAVLIAFSRLYLYVHFPTDVLGGMVVGIGCAIASCFVMNRIFRNENNN